MAHYHASTTHLPPIGLGNGENGKVFTISSFVLHDFLLTVIISVSLALC